MSDQGFQLSTPQICEIFSRMPTVTKVFVSFSARGYSTRFIGKISRVLEMFKHDAQDEFPLLNCRDSDDDLCDPMSIESVEFVWLANVAVGFDTTEEYCVVLYCNFGDSNDLLPSIQYLETPVGPSPAYQSRRVPTKPLEGEYQPDDTNRFVREVEAVEL